jgi:hypothetical protein
VAAQEGTLSADSDGRGFTLGEGGSVRSGPGEARTILLFHIISVRPSKQPLMVRTFLKVYMELGSYFLFLQKQIKDIIIKGNPNLNPHTTYIYIYTYVLFSDLTEVLNH